MTRMVADLSSIMNKSLKAQCSDVTRQLSETGALTGKPLEFAFEMLNGYLYISDQKTNALYGIIRDKIQAGTPLSVYENHYMIDTVRLHLELESN